MKRRDRALPEARSGLPGPVERQLMRRYGQTAAGRMKVAGTLRAIGVLLRRHPKAALEMAGAGALQAGRVGLGELKAHFASGRAREHAKPKGGSGRKRLSRRELRRFRKLLDRDARRDRAAPEPDV